MRRTRLLAAALPVVIMSQCAPKCAPAPAPAATSTTVWDRIAACESGGNWSINTGNGYSGGLQWLPSTWRAYRDSNDPMQAYQASRQQQIAAAERLRAVAGFRPWPACARRLGLL